TCLSTSAQDLKTPIPLSPEVRHGTLPNGMKYYVQKNGKPEKRAELRLVVNAGSTLEDDDQQGLAHFLEHMCFNGTESFPGNEIDDYLESVGVKFGPHLNAYTSFDETVYMIQVPTDKPEIMAKGLKILEEWDLDFYRMFAAVAFFVEEEDFPRLCDFFGQLGVDLSVSERCCPVPGGVD
ncbi:MAG: insulinase family protein, partial [Candidatus Caldarchaeum sp.]